MRLGTVVLLTCAAVFGGGDAELLYDFESGLPPTLVFHDSQGEIEEYGGSAVLRVAFGAAAEWPHVLFRADRPWDWSSYAGLAIDVYNPEAEAVPVYIRVDNDGADGVNFCKTVQGLALPGEVTTVVARFNAGDNRFWGMRGIPEVGEVATGNDMDPSRITAFQLFLSRPETPHTLMLDDIRLVGDLQTLKEGFSFPFIDRFGQYMHRNWPGKLCAESEWDVRQTVEREAWKDAPYPTHHDAIGGWIDGPQREATGWFRTEIIGGTWWLVTPEGRLFYSMGMDCVNTGDHTFITGRDGWFADLPARDDPAFGQFRGHVNGVHSMAETIGGEGDTFQFYAANLHRKYGESWFDSWRRASYQRLRHWGFNTFGAWSDGNVTSTGPLPFTVSLGSGRAGRGIEGAKGYWGHLMDVYDPAFATSTREALAAQVEPYKDNPLCIGYFVDNELAWETIRTGTLASPPDQPCRVAFVERLHAKYGDIEALNAAWGTQAANWDTLRNPMSWNPASDADVSSFVHEFARTYFETVRDAIRARDPHHLYLGCRFSTAPPETVAACAAVVDVISFNVYMRHVPCEPGTGFNALAKPILIGEFHFGSLDRGMFHTGLQAAPDQETRARYFYEYVRSAAACPAVVGCHWFQYVDEPTTGRVYDGENYAIGFVSVTDTPYPEMVDAAQRVSAEIYALRSGKARP